MRDYYYRTEKGNVYRYRIERDNDPISSPRDWDNMCSMYIWWNHYALGDDTNGKSMWDKLAELMEDYLPDTDYEDMTEREMSLALMLKATDKVRIYWIFVYEHSGIAISLRNNYPFNDRFDSGVGGFMVVDRETIEKNGCNWEDAYEIAEGEVNTYNCYLMGNVYGYFEDTYIGNGEWDEDTDSCWGYLSEKYGLDLVTEIIGAPISEEEAEKAMEEYDRKAEQKAEYGLRLMAM